MELSGKRVAILAEQQYEDLELWYPLFRLREAGAEVFVVGSGTADEYESKHGYPVKVDGEADTVTAAQFDAVIIPGGRPNRHEPLENRNVSRVKSRRIEPGKLSYSQPRGPR